MIPKLLFTLIAKRSNEESEALIQTLKKEIEFLRVHLKSNNISIPNFSSASQDQPAEEESGQNYYAQYKELETKYQLLEVLY